MPSEFGSSSGKPDSSSRNDGISSNYASDISPISVSSLNLNIDYKEEAKQIAIAIFNEYLRDSADYRIQMDETMKVNIFKKFGIFLDQRNGNTQENNMQQLAMWPHNSESITKNEVSNATTGD